MQQPEREYRLSEAVTAAPKATSAKPVPNTTAGTGRVAELKVSGHLMTLETGLFCVFQVPGSPSANDRSGLPGVRVSLPPGPSGGLTPSVSARFVRMAG